jgi:hypothetical protein
MTESNINLSDIVVQNIPDQPTKIWDHSPQKVFYDYKVFGYIKGQEVGHITLSLCHYSIIPEDLNDFWFEKKRGVWTPRPVAVFQKTREPFRGKGVSGELLILVNELAKQKYQMPIASDATFCSNPFWDWKEKNLAEKPAIRVWQKLEARGLAYSKPYRDRGSKKEIHPRWIMF